MLSRRCLASFASTAWTPASSSWAPAAISALCRAESASRSASRRPSSRWRIASLRSALSCSFRDMLGGTKNPPYGGSSTGNHPRFASLGGGLTLALHAGLFVVAAAARLGENAILLHPLGKAAQRRFQRLAFTYNNFRQ